MVAVLALAFPVAMATTSTATTTISLPQSSVLVSRVTRRTAFFNHQHSPVLSIPRGGSSSPTASTSKKASKKKVTKKAKKTTKKNTKKAKNVVESALKEKDSAAALGDAIRYV
jgi:hypothetical protein